MESLAQNTTRRQYQGTPLEVSIRIFSVQPRMKHVCAVRSDESMTGLGTFPVPLLRSIAVGVHTPTYWEEPFTSIGPGPIVTEVPLLVFVFAYCIMVFFFLVLVRFRIRFFDIVGRDVLFVLRYRRVFPV